ncbi:4Fe-4S binding protein [Thermodesulfobacteriota bacterium]
MVKHTVDLEKCRGCGECVDICSLELWDLVEAEGGKKKAQIVEEASEICHCCLCCRDACPEDALSVEEVE